MTAAQFPSLSPAAKHYNFETYYWEVNDPPRAAFRGETLRVGRRAPAFRLASIDGEFIDSTELVGNSHVALVFGCRSAPPAVTELPAIDQLHRDMPAGAVIIFVYTREVHPDEAKGLHSQPVPRHASIDEKMTQARAMRGDLGLSLTVCVDDLEGTTHRAFGELPFFQVVIDRQGILVHRAEWASADQLSAVLKNLAVRDERANEGKPRLAYSETLWCTPGLSVH